MKKVLVTGSGGFIGSHLTELLVDQGYQVKALVSYKSTGSYGWLDTFPKEKLEAIEVISGDIRDNSQMISITKDVDTVLHLAALIAIPYSYQAPNSYIDTNIQGTANILNACLLNNVSRVIVTSTSEVYGTALYVPIDEKHPKQPQSPYSATKIGADSIAESFYRSFNLPLTIVRPFNTFGPRQSNRAIIPTIITQLLSGYEQIKLGTLSTTRDFLYVKDTANGFLEVAKSTKLLGQEVNLATGQEISVGDLAKKIMQLTGKQAKIIQEEKRMRPDKSEVERLCGAYDKITSNSSWKPNYDLDKGLKETIEWFSKKENLKLYKSNIYSV
ncbi:MAG: GDP-mannose 4,6-dehydratase [Bacteroidetes bacterium]|nr:GDP-mannose 4,6-dehydratase [Bacteroidota bacterium]